MPLIVKGHLILQTSIRQTERTYQEQIHVPSDVSKQKSMKTLTGKKTASCWEKFINIWNPALKKTSAPHQELTEKL